MVGTSHADPGDERSSTHADAGSRCESRDGCSARRLSLGSARMGLGERRGPDRLPDLR